MSLSQIVTIVSLGALVLGADRRSWKRELVTEPIIPKYGTGCISDLMGYLLAQDGGSEGLENPIGVADQRVLLVLDGLGWDQLAQMKTLAPVMSAMTGEAITSVAPSTTATAMTSITTSLTPGEHGIVGYRMVIDDAVVNTLRWRTKEHGDVRKLMPPDLIQPYPPFLDNRPSVVTKSEFATTGFTKVHLRGGRLAGYRTPAVMVHEIISEVRAGESFVFAYWDGIDKVAHEYGLGSEYEAEVAFADYLVGSILAGLPSGVELVVTADHGQVDCGGGSIAIDREVLSLVDGLSGEGRFRWLHSAGAPADELADLARTAHGSVAWVYTRDQLVDEGWFGPFVTREAAGRLGDVALLPFEPVSFHDPDDGGIFDLIGRHGSATAAEMLVPLLTAVV